MSTYFLLICVQSGALPSIIPGIQGISAVVALLLSHSITNMAFDNALLQVNQVGTTPPLQAAEQVELGESHRNRAGNIFL